MRVAYISTNELNHDLAVQLGDECGITVFPTRSVDARHHGAFDALLYDWDSLSPLRHEETFVAALAATECPVAVHGYGLDREEAETLHQDGIAVFGRLDARIFTRLRGSVRHVRAAVKK
jgi:hypothetical protein